jgi:hypothetical protein
MTSSIKKPIYDVITLGAARVRLEPLFAARRVADPLDNELSRLCPQQQQQQQIHWGRYAARYDPSEHA